MNMSTIITVLSLLTAVVSLSFNIFLGIKNSKRNETYDIKAEMEIINDLSKQIENFKGILNTFGKTIDSLEQRNKDVDKTMEKNQIEIKTELHGIKIELKDITKDEIINKESLKSAWKQIDEIKGKIG